MKKTILILAALAAFSFSLPAQNWYAGGSASFDLWGHHFGPSADGGSFGISVNPEIGYNINDKFSAGVSMTFGISTMWDNFDNGGTFGFSLNPYFRYNIVKIGGKVTLLADAAFSIGCSAPLVKYGSPAFAYALGVKPGISYAITDRCTLVTHLAYVGFRGVGSSIDYGISLISGPSVGINWNF